MLEFYERYRKSYKDRENTKKRRVLLNTGTYGTRRQSRPIYADDELLLNTPDEFTPHHPQKYIHNIRCTQDKYGGTSHAPYERFIESRIGWGDADIYSELCTRKMYRYSRRQPREVFRTSIGMRDSAKRYSYNHNDSHEVSFINNRRCQFYNRRELYTLDWNECLEKVLPWSKLHVPRWGVRGINCRPEHITNKVSVVIDIASVLTTGLPLHVYSCRGNGSPYAAEVYIWYPYNYRSLITTDDNSIPCVSLDKCGWYGYYRGTTNEYSHELVLDKGRPVFTKQQYTIHTREGTKRVIPVGGPLLIETLIEVTTSKWVRVPDTEVIQP